MKNFIFGFLILLASCTGQTTKVACIGDSITEGFGLKVQSRSAYPVVLGELLGSDFSVLNFGRSATTMSRQGDFPYWIVKEFSNVFAENPDMVIIQLGTNDTKPKNWNPENFERSCQALVDTLNTLSSRPEIYLCLPVPVYKDVWGINDSVLTTGVIPVLKGVADKNHLPVIDLYHGMTGLSGLFPDGVHPNEEGTRLMARHIADKIKDK